MINITRNELIEVFKNWPINLDTANSVDEIMAEWKSEDYAELSADYVINELNKQRTANKELNNKLVPYLELQNSSIWTKLKWVFYGSK